MARAAKLADAQQAELHEKKKRQKCPNPSCGHKTSKPVCSKCGTSMTPDKDATGALVDQGGHACIQQWMQNNQDQNVSSELIADFDATVTSHDFRTPPDAQLAAVIEVVAKSIADECDLTAQTLQPAMVSEKASPFVGKWSS